MCLQRHMSGVCSACLELLTRLSHLTKVVSPSLQLPHSSLVRVTSKTYIAAAARDVAGLLRLQRAATLRHPCMAELRWPNHQWAQHGENWSRRQWACSPILTHQGEGWAGCDCCIQQVQTTTNAAWVQAAAQRRPLAHQPFRHATRVQAAPYCATSCSDSPPSVPGSLRSVVSCTTPCTPSRPGR